VLPSLGGLVLELKRAVDEGIYEYIPEHDVADSHLVERPPPEGYPYGLP
jgi:hypothetical protein